MSKCAECGANNFHSSYCGVPYRDAERGKYQDTIRELTADRDKWRDRCERLIAGYGVGQWTCCQPSYLHDCKTDKCWLTVYEGDGQGADFAQQIQKEIDDDAK